MTDTEDSAEPCTQQQTPINYKAHSIIQDHRIVQYPRLDVTVGYCVLQKATSIYIIGFLLPKELTDQKASLSVCVQQSLHCCSWNRYHYKDEGMWQASKINR